MIFLTVGTQFPFDRLIKAVDEAADEGVFGDEIFAQTGESSYKARNFRTVQFVDKHLFDKYIRQASSVISHAGIGTVAAVLEYSKPMLLMPRLRKYGEVVNDHQLAIAKKFEISGYVLAAYEGEKLITKINQLKTFVPRRRDSQPWMVTGRIAQFLTEVSSKLTAK